MKCRECKEGRESELHCTTAPCQPQLARPATSVGAEPVTEFALVSGFAPLCPHQAGRCPAPSHQPLVRFLCAIVHWIWARICPAQVQPALQQRSLLDLPQGCLALVGGQLDAEGTLAISGPHMQLGRRFSGMQLGSGRHCQQCPAPT